MARETPRAAEAWADYLSLGASRSLEKLLELYLQRRQSGVKASVPAVRLRTLQQWSADFGWQARLAEIAERESHAAEQRETAARAELQSVGIVDRQNRLSALNERWLALQEVIRSRAEHYSAIVAGAPADAVRGYHRPEWIAPGAETGVLVFSRRVVGKLTTEEWAADVALFREIRAHEEQAAKEMGQWTEKRELTGKDGGPIQFEDVSALSDDQLDALIAELSASAEGASGQSAAGAITALEPVAGSTDPGLPQPR